MRRKQNRFLPKKKRIGFQPKIGTNQSFPILGSFFHFFDQQKTKEQSTKRTAKGRNTPMADAQLKKLVAQNDQLRDGLKFTYKLWPQFVPIPKLVRI